MRLLGFALIVMLILIGLVYLMLRPIVAEHEERKEASQAKWKAFTMNHSPGGLTYIGVNLITPKGKVLTKQIMDTLHNEAEDYDFELTEALEKARLRAQTLNIQNSID